MRYELTLKRGGCLVGFCHHRAISHAHYSTTLSMLTSCSTLLPPTSHTRTSANPTNQISVHLSRGAFERVSADIYARAALPVTRYVFRTSAFSVSRSSAVATSMRFSPDRRVVSSAIASHFIPPPRFPVVALYHSRVWVVDGMWYRSLLHNAQLIQKEVDEVVLVGGRYGNGVI